MVDSGRGAVDDEEEKRQLLQYMTRLCLEGELLELDPEELRTYISSGLRELRLKDREMTKMLVEDCEVKAQRRQLEKDKLDLKREKLAMEQAKLDQDKEVERVTLVP